MRLTLPRSIDRRRFLRGAGGAAMALPFLGALARPSAAQAVPGGPKRVVVVVHRQGSVLNRWTPPTGGEWDWTFSDILAPLADFRDRMVVIAGLDNFTPPFNTAGDPHKSAEISLLTCLPYFEQRAESLAASGPSWESLIADRLFTTTPYRRLDFSVGGAATGYDTTRYFWEGAEDPVVSYSSPLLAYSRLFADAGLSDAEAEALRARRASVLDAVLENFNTTMAAVPSEDRQRLEAHAEKVRELEQRLTRTDLPVCAAPTIELPPQYEVHLDDDVTFGIQSELLALALACDQTRVATLCFSSGENPTFDWISSGGEPLFDTTAYGNWHGLVHSGREEEGLVTGFTWYSACVAQLLQRLAEQTDVDGENLLDTTLVVWVSEFGNGNGHNTYKLPVVLFGNLGGAPTGRYLNLMNGGPDSDWQVSGASTAQLWSTLSALFGSDPNAPFGLEDPSVPQGELLGLL